MYKVLLVDDEPFAIEGLQLLIDWRKFGFEINGICANGEEAVEAIRTSKPDLVVTDIHMPAMNGLELIEEARRLGHDSTMFVITSGYSDFNYARQAIRLGVCNYLTKPVDTVEADDMLERLAKELKEKQQRESVREQAKVQEITSVLSALATGKEVENEQDMVHHIAQLYEKAHKWTYVRVKFQRADSGLIRSTIHEVVSREACCYVVENEQNACGIVWGEVSSVPEDLEGKSHRHFAEQLLSVLHDTVSNGVQLAVGMPVQQLEALSLSRSMAAETERFLFLHQGNLLFAEDIQEQRLRFNPESLREVDLIMEHLEEGSPEQLRMSIKEAFSQFVIHKTAPEFVHIFMTQILFRGLSLCKELGGEPKDLVQNKAFLPDHRYHRNIEESASMLEEFCLTCQAAVTSLRQKQLGGTQAMVAEYLQQHFRDTFTIKELAEKFFMHPVHLGQSFMRKYGKGVLDMVHDLRIEEAMRLLRESGDASCAIAEQVGYKSYQHFLKQFERRTGLKPAEYRLKHA
ncbi:Protein-glutamate methylesterase/protein-glutamine glutaminase [Paenibacillus sp. JJ-100]|uniref:response regulator transcription factor n=1 Tax=Paenibacillus sp. JJ-100 TaxID=2974896 RepID=UPI0022FFB034|nr:response regulator [Paenibacillus sp. JJ-100]CAI6077725.1 Protein-glutamate methylesterase/protein-glutamine glutaminase [Paenibacillus sp. JJ-100]